MEFQNGQVAEVQFYAQGFGDFEHENHNDGVQVWSHLEDSSSSTFDACDFSLGQGNASYYYKYGDSTNARERQASSTSSEEEPGGGADTELPQ